MILSIETLKAFYTIKSKEPNIFSPYPKIFRCYKGNNFLPTQPYVAPLWERTIVDIPKLYSFDTNFTRTDEQEYIMNTILKWNNTYHYNCWLINMKTWRGKSFIIMELVKLFGTNTLILCHNVKTVKEMITKFKQYMWLDVGEFTGTKKSLDTITITTHTSFVKQKWDIWNYDLLIMDEADRGLSKEMIHSMCKSPAKAMYWLTWTPYRKEFNKEDMQKIFGKMIEFVDWGYNIIPQVTCIRYKSKAFKTYEYQNFAEEKSLLINDNERLATQMKFITEELKDRKAILILTERIEEADNYYNELSKYTENVFKVTGQTKIKDDEDNIAKLYDWKNRIIIWTVWKMARGVDISIVDTVCIFASLQFRWTIIQATGRALRKHKNKDNALLVMWSDIWLLDSQHYQRIKAVCKEYKLSKDDINIITIETDGNNNNQLSI